MVLANDSQQWLFCLAAFFGDRAARMKVATARRMDRRRRFAQQRWTVGHVAVVLVLTDQSDPQHGVSAFICDIGEGCRPGKKENKLGMRTSDTAELILEDLRVGPDRLLGKENEGFVDALKVLDGGRISIAALSLGITLGCLDNSRKYAKERRAFGREIAAAPDPEVRRRELEEEMAEAQSIFPRAEEFGAHHLIDPRETRPLICDWLDEVGLQVAGLSGPRSYSIRP